MSAISANNTTSSLRLNALLSSANDQPANAQSKLAVPVGDLFDTTPIRNGQNAPLAHNETRTPTTTTTTAPTTTTPTTTTPVTTAPTTTAPTTTSALPTPSTTQATQATPIVPIALPRGVTTATHMPPIGTVDTGITEVKGATTSVQKITAPPPDPTLPDGQLKTNPDGSVTTPGGYTISNQGNTTWTITSPTGQVTKISGDPHVDEGNDGTTDWNFNANGTFILGDGTKIYDATDHYSNSADGAEITVSHTLDIQYKDSLATMDVLHDAGAAATTLSQTGGEAFDKATPDGLVFVEGRDGTFYDGATLNKLVANGQDFSVSTDASKIGFVSDNALISLKGALKEMGLSLSDTNPTNDGPALKKVNEEDLGTLSELDNSSFLVDDSDNSLENAAASHGAVGKGKILGQANQAGNGMASLAQFDTNGDGVLTGDELKNVKVWTDKNGNGKVDDGEISVLADFNVKSLNVKMAVTPQDDGNTRLDGMFNRDGNTVTTSDIINPLVQTAQGVNFQRELNNQLTNDPQGALMAQSNLNRVADLMNQLPTSDGPQQPGVIMNSTINNNRAQSIQNTRA